MPLAWSASTEIACNKLLEIVFLREALELCSVDEEDEKVQLCLEGIEGISCELI